MNRYARHLIMPEIGKKGQQKIAGAKVLVVGAGGIGCPALLYLAATGIGTLGIIDSDIVDETNLPRQILFGEDDVGKPKTEVAKKALAKINSETHIKTYNERMIERNAEKIIKNFDIVIDGADNIATKYLINDACVKFRKPYVYGAVAGFHGLVSVFRRKPCYRCMQPREADAVLSCHDQGIIGTTAGIVAIIQTNEAIKLILNKGKMLEKRLLVYDGLNMTFREIKIKWNKECKMCRK